jgi:hypothetical protein
MLCYIICTVSVIGFLAVDAAHKNKEYNCFIKTIIIIIISSVL